MKEKLIGLLEIKLWFSEGTCIPSAASLYTATFIIHVSNIFVSQYYKIAHPHELWLQYVLNGNC